MATKTYSTRRKVAGVKHTMPCVNTSSDLFDSFVSHAKKAQSPSTSPLKTKPTGKSSPGSGKKGGKTCTQSPIMYRYSYSPSTAVATTIRKESPTKGKSGTKKKVTPKQKVSLKIFDFTSDDESDGTSKKVKTGSKSVQKDSSRTEKKKTVKKTKKATSGQLSDGNQVSDSEYSSQDSQMQSVAMETKTKSPKKSKTTPGGQKTAKKSAAQKAVGGDTKSAPAASVKRKSTTSEKATPPKKPRVETPLTPPPGKTRVTRSGRLTRSTYRAAALWGEKMDTSESSQQQEAVAMDVEDPIQVTDAVPSVGDFKGEEKGSPEREIKEVGEVGEGDVKDKEGSPEKEGGKIEVEGEEGSAGKAVEEVGVKDQEEPCSQGGEEPQVSGKGEDVASGFDVLDSDQPDKPDERSAACLDDENESEHGSVSPPTCRQVDELVSDTNQSDSGAKVSSAADMTKSKCDDGESDRSSEQRVEQTPTSEPPGPSASSSSKLNEEVSDESKEPVSIVVEEWEESQEGAEEGGEKEESMDVSLSEPVDEPANPRLFERHLVPSLKKSNSGICGPSKSFPDIDVPSLTRTSSWPRCSGSVKGNNGSQKTGLRCSRQEKELITVVRNVREAHECLEMGESQQFFDEMDYLLDNISPEQPLNVRCLGTCNLASHCMDTEFSRQMRAHGFTNKIISHLKDSLQHPGLCLSTATLFYVMTRDRYNSEWSRAGVDLLVGMLAAGGMEADLTGKAAREFSRTKSKARALLERAMEKHSPRQGSPEEEKEEEEKEKEKEEEEKEGERVRRKPGASEHRFRVDVENISVCELSREALLALTSPQHNPHWMREELRISGALDHLANMVISGCELLEGGVEEGEGGDKCEGGEGTERRLRVLERVLKTLENVTLMNKDNQSYLIVFDGSLLVSKLTRLVAVCHSLAKEETIRNAAVDCLLAVMKLLLNLTHDSELGSHRVGGQKGAMEAILSTIFQLPDLLPEEHHFDIIVLGLGLLINMSEHSAQNRTQLQSTRIDDHSTESSQETAKKEEEEDIRMMQDDVMGCHGNRSSMKALIRLFLKHHAKSEQVSIEVPTPQRLSQLSSSPHSSPLRAASQVRRDLTPSFTASGRAHRLGKTHRSRSPKKAAGSSCGDGSQGDGMGWLPEEEDKAESEEEEEFESIATDPLVFSREEFDTALNQAGRHMEDSIVASYTALLLGILAKHNPDSVDAIRREMPSKNFSDMIAVLRKFVSFMSIAGTSGSGLDSIRHIVKYLEAL